jgi:hypothetical protein
MWNKLGGEDTETRREHGTLPGKALGRPPTPKANLTRIQIVKKPILALLGLGLLGLVIRAIPDVAPKRSAENTVFSEVGRHESPHGAQVVNVSRENDGALKIAVTSSYGGGGSMTAIQASSDWFMF